MCLRGEKQKQHLHHLWRIFYFEWNSPYLGEEILHQAMLHCITHILGVWQFCAEVSLSHMWEGPVFYCNFFLCLSFFFF